MPHIVLGFGFRRPVADGSPGKDSPGSLLVWAVTASNRLQPRSVLRMARDSVKAN
jgi:hypothetical protein